MRHTPCGCRSAHLVEVQPNFRLPPVSTMRQAQQCRYFASSLPPRKRHSRLTTVRRGCCQITTRRDSWRSHVHRTRLRSACSPSSCKPAMAGSRGRAPCVLLGVQGGIFSHVREYPPYPQPHTVWGKPRSAFALPFYPAREKIRKGHLSPFSFFVHCYNGLPLREVCHGHLHRKRLRV